VALIIVSVLVFRPGAQRVFNNTKAWEFTTQFLFIVVLGGAIGFAYKRWETARSDEKLRKDEERELRSLKRAALEDVYRSFNEVHFDDCSMSTSRNRC
jgi:hypothetical protein